jgi:hypothetical protein
VVVGPIAVAFGFLQPSAVLTCFVRVTLGVAIMVVGF